MATKAKKIKPLVVPASKKRNPLVAPALQRKAGVHRKDNSAVRKAENQAAKKLADHQE
jgi:hypothetical protein